MKPLSPLARQVAAPLLAGVLGLLGSAASQAQSGAAAAPPPSAVLIENVRIFDGLGERLSPPSHVLVVGNQIRKISSSPIRPDPAWLLQTIQGGGRTLMPGLIDAHTHLMFIACPRSRC
jgi:imidazolonepropionase-like amidohydrolase